MPEEIEVPTEHLHETLQEHAEHAEHGEHGHGEGPPSWVSQVALSAAMFAVLAAISALLAGHHANEAMLEQMKATDKWAYFQAKGIKANVLQTKIDLLEAMKQPAKEEETKHLAEYAKEQKDIGEEAKEGEHASEKHMLTHGMLARSVTAFQVAIALSAISVLARRKALWYLSLVLGAIGAVALTLAFL